MWRLGESMFWSKNKKNRYTPFRIVIRLLDITDPNSLFQQNLRCVQDKNENGAFCFTQQTDDIKLVSHECLVQLRFDFINNFSLRNSIVDIASFESIDF